MASSSSSSSPSSSGSPVAAVEVLADGSHLGSFHGAVFNTVNTIIGGGVLALPFVFARTGLALAVTLLVLGGLFSSYSASLALKAAVIADAHGELTAPKASDSGDDVGLGVDGDAGRRRSRGADDDDEDDDDAADFDAGGGGTGRGDIAVAGGARRGSAARDDIWVADDDGLASAGRALGVASAGAAGERPFTSAHTHASYKALAQMTFGGKWGARVVDCLTILFLLGACTGYCVIIGDMFAPFVFQYIVNGGNEPLAAGDCDVSANERDTEKQAIWTTTTLVIIFIGITILFPLLTLQRIDSLRFTSLVAIACIVFLCGSIVGKGIEPAGENMAKNPGDIKVAIFNGDFFAVLPIATFAFTFHPNLFPIAVEMKQPLQMHWVVRISVFICASAYIAVGVFGYLTFLGDVQDNVLLSYPKDDILITVGRLALGLIICFSYPVIGYTARATFDALVFGVKTSDVLSGDAGQGPLPLPRVPLKRRVAEAAGFVGITMFFAIVVPNISFVFGLVGATVGNMLVFILPSAFYVHANYLAESGVLLAPSLDGASLSAKAHSYGRFLRRSWKRTAPAIGLIIFGICMTFASVIMIFSDLFEGKYEPDPEQELDCTQE